MTSLTNPEVRNSNSSGSKKGTNPSNKSSSPQGESDPLLLVSSKKRTFDIAFLTGQTEAIEKESNNNHSRAKRHNSISPTTTTSTSSYCFNSINSSPVASISNDERDSPFNLCSSQRGHEAASDTSSLVDVDVDIDVMTNGSLSDGEEEKCLNLYKSRNSRVLLSLSQSHNFNNQTKIHHPIPQNSSTSVGSSSSPTKVGKGKSGKNAYPKNNPVKEEIRFESKRTIDINHSQDSLKIKENLQFSTLIPNNGHNPQQMQIEVGSHQSHHHGQNPIPDFNELLFPPHLASTFALFPQFSGMSKFHGLSFPMQHHPNALVAHAHQQQQHQNAISRVSPSNSNQSSSSPQNQSQGQSISPLAPTGIHFSSSSTKHLEVPKFERSGDHSSSSSYRSSGSSHHQNSSNKIRTHFPELCYPSHGYPYPNLIIQPQCSPPGAGGLQTHNSQYSPNNSGTGPNGSTLLPPSLTALTLPAQNVCAKCNIGFRMTSDLVYHMRSHHKRDTFDPMRKQREEKLKCPVCHESFRERHHLTRHMTAHEDRKNEQNEIVFSAATATNITTSHNNSGGDHFISSSSGAGTSGSKLVA